MPRRIITALAAATALAFGAACADDAPPAAPPVTEAPAPAPEPVPEPARHEGPWYDLLDDSHGYIGGARLNDAWAELVVAQDGAGGLPPELWPEAVLIDVRRALAAVDRALVAERRYTDAAAYDRLAKLEANQAEMRALLP